MSDFPVFLNSLPKEAILESTYHFSITVSGHRDKHKHKIHRHRHYKGFREWIGKRVGKLFEVYEECACCNDTCDCSSAPVYGDE